MCNKHLWPFCISRKKGKDGCIHPCDDSSRKRYTSIAPDNSSGDSKENSATQQQPTVRSLIEGKWVQEMSKNFEALSSALSETKTDLEVAKTVEQEPFMMTCRNIDSKGEVWEFMYESVQRGFIKNISKVGEECDELTPIRQWVKSTLTMPNINTMKFVQKYKNGTQTHTTLEVKPTDPDQLILTICYDEVVTVLTGRRVKEINN